MSSGKIRLNKDGFTEDQNTATKAFISETDDSGNSIGSTLDTIDSVTSSTKGHIRIAKKNRP